MLIFQQIRHIRIIGLIAIFAFGLASIIASGGGGSSDGGTQQPPKATPPEAPESVASIAGGEQCIVRWKTVNSATSYTIYWSTSADVTPSKGNAIGKIPQTTYHLAPLTNGQTYYYVVTAVGVGGESNASIPQSCTPHPIVITKVAAGILNSVALDDQRMVWTWGFGPFGDGTFADRRPLPAPVCAPGSIAPCTSFLSDIVDIRAGQYHVVALKTDGTVWTWGDNHYGQLGNGTLFVTDVPIQVCASGATATCTSYLSDVSSIAAGLDYTLALKNDGTVWAWGHNEYGSLGDGTDVDRTTPVQVCASGQTTPCSQFLTDVTAIAANDANEIGASHNLALKSDGSVQTWGGNYYGQLGTTTNPCGTYNVPCSTIPVGIAGLTGVAAVTAGRGYSVVLKTDGTVWAWGLGQYGRLGDGQGTDSMVPVQVCEVGQTACNSHLSGITAISAADSHTVAVRNDGTAVAWGNNNSGVLGDGTSIPRYVPVVVSGLSNTAQIAAGGSHNLARLNDGTLRTWGSNSVGQLGRNRVFEAATPRLVAGLDNVAEVSAGGGYITVRRSDDTVWSWGSMHNRHAGYGTTESVSTPVPVTAITNAAELGGGGADQVVLRLDSTLAIWGVNNNGSLGNGSLNTYWSVQTVCDRGQTYPCTAELAGVTEVAHGSLNNHLLAVKDDGTVWAWGDNGFGQLGDGTTTSRSAPVQVCASGSTAPCASFLSGIVSVAAGASHSLALGSDGTVWAWGRNLRATLGDGTTVDSVVPIKVCASAETAPCTQFLSDVVAIAAGSVHSVALTSDGTAWMWGDNTSAQLGDGSNLLRATPVPVCIAQTSNNCSALLTNVAKISAGYSHTLALQSDGTVWAWGLNTDGQLGSGSIATSSFSTLLPAKVCGIDTSSLCESELTDIIDISAGFANSVALQSNGKIVVWGSNDNGELGDGSLILRYLPDLVTGL